MQRVVAMVVRCASLGRRSKDGDSQGRWGGCGDHGRRQRANAPVKSVRD